MAQRPSANMVVLTAGGRSLPEPYQTQLSGDGYWEMKV